MLESLFREWDLWLIGLWFVGMVGICLGVAAWLVGVWLSPDDAVESAPCDER